MDNLCSCSVLKTSVCSRVSIQSLQRHWMGGERLNEIRNQCGEFSIQSLQRHWMGGERLNELRNQCGEFSQMTKSIGDGHMQFQAHHTSSFALLKIQTEVRKTVSKLCKSLLYTIQKFCPFLLLCCHDVVYLSHVLDVASNHQK